MKLNQLKAERSKDKLRQLVQKDGNKSCFDCGVRGPLYVVTDFHIFVCSICSSAHRSFQHKVKGISVCTFSDKEMAEVEIGGNDVASKIWLAHFKGTKPRSGDIHAIQDFVKSAFVKELYVDKAKKEEFEKNIQYEMNPKTNPRETTEAPKRMDPPSAQINAATPQTGSPVHVVTSTQQQQPQPPQVDLFSGLLAEPGLMSTTRSASNPKEPSNAKPLNDFPQDLFSVPQTAHSCELVPQPSYIEPSPPLQQQQHLAGAPHAIQGNGVGNFPHYPTQNMPDFFTASHNPARVSITQANLFQHQDNNSNFDANSASRIVPVGLQPQPQMTGNTVSQWPFTQTSSFDFFHPTKTNLLSPNISSAPAMTTHQPVKKMVTEMCTDDKAFASLDPFGMK